MEEAEDYINEDERLCTDLDDDQCRFTYVYGYHNKIGQLQVRSMFIQHSFYCLMIGQLQGWVQENKECPQTSTESSLASSEPSWRPA